MSASNLADAMKTALLATDFIADNPALDAFCAALAGAIVAEVQEATLTFNATNTTSLGVTTTPGNPIGPPATPAVVNGAVS